MHDSHTGRELSLMLEGKKPLAVFQDLVFVDGTDDEIERDFAVYVDQGQFVRHEEQDLWPKPQPIRGKLAVGTRVQLYARSDEKWRINAYLLLTEAAKGQPWNDALESFVGRLLGYTEEEVAAWLAHVHESHGSWGAVPAYFKVSTTDLEKLQQLGLRALPPDLEAEPVLILSGPPPENELLNSVYSASAIILMRFGLDTKFALKLPFEEVRGVRTVRLSRDSIPDLNRNLKSSIAIVQQHNG